MVRPAKISVRERVRMNVYEEMSTFGTEPIRLDVRDILRQLGMSRAKWLETERSQSDSLGPALEKNA